MNIQIDINIRYTERVASTLGLPQSARFSYATGVPFPETGDYVETEFDSGIRPLKVIERVFAFAENAQRIQLLLDLPD